MADITKKIAIQIQAILGKSGKDIGKLSDSLKDIKTNAKGASGALDMASVAVGSFVGQLGVQAVTAFASAVGSLATQMIELGTKTEKTISQINAMRNYVGNATEAYRAFNDVARNTNFNMDSVQQMGVQLLNMGYNAQQASDLLNLCADAAAGLNKGEEGARQLVDAISRIQATGELSSRQLLQLQMAGVNLDEVFSSVGMTGEQAMKAMNDGTLDAQKSMDALISYMHKFDGAMKESKDNVSDLWGDVKTNVETAMGEIGASIFEAFNKSGILQTLIDATNDLVDLVRGEGCGAFSDLGAIASEALDLINTGIQIVVTAIKFIILTLDECYSAFVSFGQQVYQALQPAIDALAEMFSFVKAILGSIGKGFASEVNASWRKTFGADPDDPGNMKVLNPRAIRSAVRSGGGGGGGGGGASAAVSQLQKKIEALIEKYADAGKVARELTKKQIELAKVSLGMMSEEMRVTEEKKVKLDTLNLAHETMMAGLNAELDIAKQIADADTRNKVIDAINAQITAENNLLEAKKKQIEFDDVRDQQKLKDSAFEQEMQHIENLFNMQQVFSSKRIEMENNVLLERKKQLEEMLADERLFAEEKIRIETQLAEVVKQINDNSVNDFKNGWEQALRELANQQINFKDRFMDVFSGIENGLVNLISATGSAKDRFKNFLNEITNSILKAMAQIIVRGLVMNAVMSIFGGGFGGSVGFGNLSSMSSLARSFTGGSLLGYGFASGGFVRGAGTSSSDSIPAMLSNGEYVLNASAVKRIGIPRLNAMNHFAGGGYVGGYAPTGDNAPNVVINVDNQTGSDVTMEQNGSKFDGEKWIISVVMKGMANNTMGMRSAFKGVTST